MSGLIQNSSGTHTYFQFNKDVNRKPASNQKMITTAAAYHLFGENHTFDTGVYFNGSFANGVLNGDLIIYGQSDYTMHDEYGGRYNAMDDIKADLLQLGLRQVNGNVIAMGDFYIQKNPDLAKAASDFLQTLTSFGTPIGVSGRSIAGGRVNPPGTLVVTYSSRPIKEAFKILNKSSDNQYADTTLVHLGLLEKNQVSFACWKRGR